MESAPNDFEPMEALGIMIDAGSMMATIHGRAGRLSAQAGYNIGQALAMTLKASQQILDDIKRSE